MNLAEIARRRGEGGFVRNRELASPGTLIVALGLAVVMVLALVAAPALAAQTHVFTGSFGEPGSGDGQLELREHSGVAVNEATHDVYVADTGNHRVVEFDPSKPPAEKFIRAFGADVGGPGVNVCTAGCVAGTSGSTPGAFETPTFIAVDNSGGPSSGDVYVGDTAGNLVSINNAGASFPPAMTASGRGLLPPHNHRALNFNHSASVALPGPRHVSFPAFSTALQRKERFS
jgi:NHL repeat